MSISKFNNSCVVKQLMSDRVWIEEGFRCQNPLLSTVSIPSSTIFMVLLHSHSLPRTFAILIAFHWIKLWRQHLISRPLRMLILSHDLEVDFVSLILRAVPQHYSLVFFIKCQLLLRGFCHFVSIDLWKLPLTDWHFGVWSHVLLFKSRCYLF